jgi:hypothetical protein
MEAWLSLHKGHKNILFLFEKRIERLSPRCRRPWRKRAFNERNFVGSFALQEHGVLGPQGRGQSIHIVVGAI